MQGAWVGQTVGNIVWPEVTNTNCNLPQNGQLKFKIGKAVCTDCVHLNHTAPAGKTRHSIAANASAEPLLPLPAPPAWVQLTLAASNILKPQGKGRAQAVLRAPEFTQR